MVIGPLCLVGRHAQVPGLNNSDPLSPQQEQATFQLLEGFKVELVVEIIIPSTSNGNSVGISYFSVPS